MARSRDGWVNPVESPPYASTPLYLSGSHGTIQARRPLIAKENRRGFKQKMGPQEDRLVIFDVALVVGGQGVEWGGDHLKRLPFTPRRRLAPGLPMEPGGDRVGQSFPEFRRAVQRGCGFAKVLGFAIIYKPLIPQDPQLEGLVVVLQASFDTALIVVRHGSLYLVGQTR